MSPCDVSMFLSAFRIILGPLIFIIIIFDIFFFIADMDVIILPLTTMCTGLFAPALGLISSSHAKMTLLREAEGVSFSSAVR